MHFPCRPHIFLDLGSVFEYDYEIVIDVACRQGTFLMVVEYDYEIVNDHDSAVHAATTPFAEYDVIEMPVAHFEVFRRLCP